MLTSDQTVTAARNRKPTRRSRGRTERPIFSDRDLATIYRDVERYIARWLCKVIIVDDDGTPRKLTEAEIEDGIEFTRAENRREWANERRRRERARRRKAAKKRSGT
jgi:hypothetical protein